MVENTMTTPADINHVIMVGLTSISSGVGCLVTALNFFTCLSLLDSRDFRFGATLGERDGEWRSLAFSSDSGMRRRAVG